MGGVVFVLFVAVIGLLIAVLRLVTRVRELGARLDLLEGRRVASGGEVARARPHVDESAPGTPGALVTTSAATSVARASGATPASLTATAKSTAQAAAASRTPRSLEQLVGGRVLLVAGVIAVLVALGYFLKIAVERGWLPPPARIALGSAAGAALLFVGDRVRVRGLVAYGHALMGLGLGALFVCVDFAALRYALIGRPAAFALTLALAGTGALLAVWRSAPLLAWLGFLGGYLAPALLGQDVDALESLTLWLLVVDVGVLAFLLARPARGLVLMPACWTAVYLAAWSLRFADPSRADAAGLCALELAIAFVALSVLPALRRRTEVDVDALVALLLGLGVTGAFAYDLLHEPRPRWLAAGEALVALMLAVSARRRWTMAFGAASPASAAPTSGAVTATDASPPPAVVDVGWLALLALAGFAASLAELCEGRAFPPAWTVLALLALLLGRVRGLVAFVPSAFALLAVAALRGLTLHAEARGLDTAAFVPIVDPTTLSALVPAAGLVVAARLVERRDDARLDDASIFAVVPGMGLLTLFVARDVGARIAHDAQTFGDEALRLALVASALAAVVLALGAAFATRPERQRSAAWIVPPLAGALLLGTAFAGHERTLVFTPVLDATFGLGALLVALLLLVGRRARGAPALLASGGAGLLLLILLSTDLHAWGELAPLEGAETRLDLRFAATVWISVVWALYAGALVGLGFLLRRPAVRWAGLLLFGLTVFKVFLSDLARLDTVYRVGSSLGLGVLLLLASLLYQRTRPGGEGGPRHA